MGTQVSLQIWWFKKKRKLFIWLHQVLAAAPAISFPDQGWNLGPCIGSAES